MRQQNIAGPRGFSPESSDMIGINRTGATILKGWPVRLDIIQSAGESTDNLSGKTSSGLVNIIKVNAQTVGYGIIGVALEDIENDSLVGGRIRLSGIVEVFIGRLAGTATIAPGDGLLAASAKTYLDADLPATSGGFVQERVVGIMLSDATGTVVADTPELATVLFDGINGFASMNTIS